MLFAFLQEGSLKKIPIMLIGNKVDARPDLESRGRRVVKYEDGLRLSRVSHVDTYCLVILVFINK